MTKVEQIIEALDNPERSLRARHMFNLLEEERRAAVEVYKEHHLETDIKLAMNNPQICPKQLKEWIEDKYKELRTRQSAE